VHARWPNGGRSTARYRRRQTSFAAPGSLSVQESSFVNFVGVRVKALRELSHAARPVRFQSPFRPVASARAAKPLFLQGIFSGERGSTAAARRRHSPPGLTAPV